MAPGSWAEHPRPLWRPGHPAGTFKRPAPGPCPHQQCCRAGGGGKSLQSAPRDSSGGEISGLGAGLRGTPWAQKFVPFPMILNDILLQKKKDLEELKRRFPPHRLRKAAEHSVRSARSFRKAVSAPKGLNLICEMKKASPSEGILREGAFSGFSGRGAGFSKDNARQFLKWQIHDTGFRETRRGGARSGQNSRVERQG